MIAAHEQPALQTVPGPSDRPHALRWFLLSLGVYVATVYGTQLRWSALLAPTRPHHYIAQAQSWLNGRLDLEPNIGLRDLSPVNGRDYSCFSPGPTLLLLVPAAIAGDRIPDVLLGCLLAAGSVACLHQALWQIARVLRLPLSIETLTWLTAFYALGTIVWVNVPWRGVWFLAHWFSLLGLTGSLLCAASGRATLAGVAWAFAFASRPPTVGALPALLYLVWKSMPDSRPSARHMRSFALFLIGPLLMIVFIAVLNWAQFGSPLDFGRARMNVVSVYADRLKQGVFSPVFLTDNIWAFFLAPPRYVRAVPYLVSAPYGTSLFFTSPAFLCLGGAIRRDRRLGVFWLATGLTLLPLLFYYGHESSGIGARYLLDFYPLLFVLLGFAVGSPLRWWARLLISVDIVYTFLWVHYVLLRWS